MKPQQATWRRHRGSRRSFVCFLAALTALALLLTACGSGAAADGQTQKVTPTAARAPRPTVLPASTKGWAIYTDKRFHFQAPIPPGWKAKAYTAYECSHGGDGAYIVGFFPSDLYPDAPGAIPSDYPFGKIHEYMDVYLPLCSTGGEGIPDPNRPTPEPGGILIGATHAPYYVHDNSDWISRYTSASFGEQAYIFYFEATPQDKGLRDLPLFHAMLAGFTYEG